MTPERIAELRRLAQQATPGPWTTTETSNGGRLLRRGESWREHPQFSLQVVPESDAEFIAACRVAVPELLDEIERLQRELENMDDEMRVQHERDTMED